MERTRPKKPAFAVLRPGQERFAMCWVVPMRPVAPLMLATMRRSMNVAVCAQERSPAAHGKAHMSRVASLFSRRVPLRIWLPIVIACAVAGYVASTLRPPTADQPHTPRSERPSQASVTSPVDEHEPIMTAGQLLRAIGPLRDVVEHREQTPVDVGAPAPPPRATKGKPPRTRASLAKHAAARASRPQRTAQQPAKAPSTPSAGLKNIPLIGPVFSLFQ